MTIQFKIRLLIIKLTYRNFIYNRVKFNVAKNHEVTSLKE